MIVDTSALIALVNREPEWRDVLACLEGASTLVMSSVSALELSIVLGSSRFGMSSGAIETLLARAGVTIADFTAAHSAAAAGAYARFGRGNHAARLNFGDCAAYATAILADDSLLFVGDDFVKTDVASALT